MKQTLESWYAQNKLTAEQYYALVDIINPLTEYQLSELILLANLPSTETLPNPNPNELSKYQQERDNWFYDEALKEWLDKSEQVSFTPTDYLLAAVLLTIFFYYLLK